jgi:Fe-S cluster assembly protein SufB
MMSTNNMHSFKPSSFPKGLSAQIVSDISAQKNEPVWMREFRLKALSIFEQKPMPTWGADLSELIMDDIYYYVHPRTDQQTSWEEVPATIKETFTALGILQAEQKYLAGVGAQYESEIIYKTLKIEWREQGVLFMDMSSAVREYPDLVQQYFATIIPPHDNKFAALNSAVWSGGSFVYVPAGVQVTMPLQAYFRINQQSMGQFERTLIIAEPGSFVHYVEGCSAPLYTKSSLHSAVVELIALPGAHIRYTTIQNWSHNVYNLVTKRAVAHDDAMVEWIDGNFGSKVTMKYPCIILKGSRSKGTIMSLAVAGAGQVQDAGGKMIHIGKGSSSHIISKSISKNGGRSSYRGLLKVVKGAYGTRAQVQCDALLLDPQSRTDTYPTNQINEARVSIAHEASVSKLSAEQLWYLQIRGFSAQEAQALVINGFINSFIDQLPMEYAVEINRLINHEMAGSIG